ncbi:bifunctional metallophosphatase/5'-nucleotidase [Ramlibacter sp. MMS24-I3-19]|uniref:bifunctional metallophosphatase/5'-nucleotidase n=1 Tax=Ramlibacter sp. MMS24-I3-19 TaxID=3416606 RepID=UPI003D0361A2
MSPEWRARVSALLLGGALLAGCSQLPRTGPADSAAPVHLQLLAFNDFHGNLEPPRLAINASAAGATTVRVPAGGAAYLASAVRDLRSRNPYTAVVAAGDLVSASPMPSSLFLDEPTVAVANAIGLDFNAVGNHEFDRGAAELLRLQNGGCERYTQREPCALDKPFPGARFQYLAANVLRADGGTLLPATGVKEFRTPAGPVRVGFIGMTLRETPVLVSPSGVAGLTFADEASTANALVPTLKAQGADVIVVLIHQGGATTGGYDDKSCPGLTGDIVPILAKLDPAIDVVVSGHTHRAYICDHGRIDPKRPFLLTSAGQYGTLLTSIALTFDPRTRRVVAKTADNVIVQGEGFVGAAGQRIEVTPQYPRFDKAPDVAAIVERYVAAAAPLAERVVGRLAASITRAAAPSGEMALGDLVADAQLAAMQAPQKGGAQLAFTNPGGVRADLLVPAGGGPVTYGQLYAAQPFGNTLVVKTMTGAQIKAVLEQNLVTVQSAPRVLQPSANFSYTYDARGPKGSRVVAMRLDGVPVDPARSYRVAMNSFLAAAGDGYTVFTEGTSPTGGGLDLDALESYIAAQGALQPPVTSRVLRVQ